MFTVIITEKGGDQRRMDFDKPEVTIGRVQGNDIILPKGNVSKRHSRIVLKDGKFIIVDLKSTNGTYVNGRKITSPLVLKDTDKIYIGDFILSLDEGAEASDGLSSASEDLPAGPPPRESLVASPPPLPRKSPPPAPPPRRALLDDDEPEDEEDVDLSDAGSLSPPTDRPGRSLPNLGPPPAAPPPPVARAAPPMSPPLDDPRTLPPPRAMVAPAPPLPGLDARPGPTPAPPIPPPAPRPVGVATRDIAAPVPPPPPRPFPTSPPPVLGEDNGVSQGHARPAAMRPVVAPPPQAPPVVRAPVRAPDSPGEADRRVELLREVYDRLWSQLDLARVPLDRLTEEGLWQRAESAVCDLVEQLEADGALPKGVDQDELIRDSLNELLGLGPLDELMSDQDVTEIHVNRPSRILVRHGDGSPPRAASRVFSSETSLRNVVLRLVGPSGSKLDAQSPLVDVRLAGGVRVTACAPPLAPGGVALTLRKPPRRPVSLDDLVGAGALSPNMAQFLSLCVRNRQSILVCGAAGAGKSVLLGALAGVVPAEERMVVVEEVAELRLGDRDGVLSLEARPPDPDGRGGVQLADVLRAAERMRPDRLVVGDVRGAEAFELVTALAARHEGGLAALSAEGPRAALSRLESLCRLGVPGAPAQALREVVAQAFHVLVHVARYADGRSRVTAISEPSASAEGFAVRDLFSFQLGAPSPNGLQGHFVGAGDAPAFYETLAARGVSLDPGLFR
jgi:pilus assembly protein CpaF